MDPTDTRGWRLGGGVTYGAMAVSRLGLPVRVLMGVDDETANAHELELLRGAGVELRLVRLARGPVFANRYPIDGGREQVALQASDRLPARALPREWQSADAVVLAPVAGELDPGWARTFRSETLVALGWQGLLRRLVPRETVHALPVRPLALVHRADLAVVSAEDIRAGGATLGRLLGRPGQQLVVTHGPRPALHITAQPGGTLRMRLLPVRRVQRPRDPTGAGDVFLATWLSAMACLRARGISARPWRPLAMAAAAAAAMVENGPLQLAGPSDLVGRGVRLLDSQSRP